MALSGALRNSFTPEEIEFIAQDEVITIIPNLRLPNLHRYLQASTPTTPLRPPLGAKVPLWLALTLRKRKKCQIVPPDWMDVDKLKEMLDYENQDESRFAPLPFHYMEIASMIFEIAADDIPQSDVVRTLLKDIREARQAKTRDGFQAIRSNYLQMDNLSLMEVNEIRPFFATAFDNLKRLEGQDDINDDTGADGDTNTQDVTQDSSMREVMNS